jgi:NTE family protein
MEKQRKLGLALGGGGARGLAHIGVLRVLEEAGIHADMVSGSSMGGVVAAAYAAGKSPAEIEQIAFFYANPRNLVRMLDPTPFRRGFLQGKPVREMLEKALGAQTTFADTRIPVALTTTDLPRGELVVLKEGNLVEATMATCAVPGLWPPVSINGRQLADGGLLNNIPVDVLRQMGADVVVAVRVAPIFPRKEECVLDVPLLPTFGDNFYQSILILSDALTSYQLEKNPPDVMLTPEIPDCVWLLGFDKPAEAIRAGEEATQQALSAIQQALGLI